MCLKCFSWVIISKEIPQRDYVHFCWNDSCIKLPLCNNGSYQCIAFNKFLYFILYFLYRGWLDIGKRIFVQGFLWLTLAFIFLTGTHRITFFSLGYLIGAFIFLWLGNDLYLRPIRIILKWWAKYQFNVCFKFKYRVGGVKGHLFHCVPFSLANYIFLRGRWWLCQFKPLDIICDACPIFAMTLAIKGSLFLKNK